MKTMGSITVADNFDLPMEKRVAYVIDALDDLSLDDTVLSDAVIETGYMLDTPQDCEAVDVCPELASWLKERDAELKTEIETLRSRLTKKWKALL